MDDSQNTSQANYEYPKLRWPIEVSLEKAEEQLIILVRCPYGISKPLALIPDVAPIISSFDGNSSVSEIVSKFPGNNLNRDVVTRLASLLDESLFLDTERFHQAQKSFKQDFAALPLRQAALAGLSYPNEGNALAFEIDSYLDKNPPANERGLVGLIAPHIDYPRGGMSYGKTYNALRNETHDLYIILGTAHQGGQAAFHLCDKDFDNPLGVINTDKEFVRKLAEQYGETRAFADQFLHKQEHSIELQLPFLKRVNADLQIVPILSGSFHHMVLNNSRPESFEDYECFAKCLTNCIKERQDAGQKVCLIAAVDMAHVGRCFGDADSLNPELMADIENKDKLYLEAIQQQDKEKLFRHILEDGDARKICGFPSVYTLIDVLSRLGLNYEGRILDYAQSVNYETDCGVTYAGMALYQKL